MVHLWLGFSDFIDKTILCFIWSLFPCNSSYFSLYCITILLVKMFFCIVTICKCVCCSLKVLRNLFWLILTFLYFRLGLNINLWNNEKRVIDYLVHFSFSRSYTFRNCCNNWLIWINCKDLVWYLVVVLYERK